nr:peptidyl-prolyl cis-trans isomerase FKBP43-like [Ipomoea batatas]
MVFESEEDNSSQESEDEDDCYLSASISKIPTKKYYIFESDDDNNAHENKGEESCLLSEFKNKTHAKATSSKCREKSGNVTDEATCQAENGGSDEDGREENVDAVDMTSMSNISKDQLSGIDKRILAPEHDSVTGKIAMPSKCEDAKSPEVAVSDQGDMFTSLNTEQLTDFDKEHQVHVGTEHVQKVASDMDTVDHSDSLAPPTEEQVENSPKLTKNGSDRMGLHECKDSSPGDAVEEVKQVSEATDMDEDLLATTEDNNVLTSTQNIVDDSDSLEPAPEVKDENGPKLKKRKKGRDGVKLNECKDSGPDDAAEEVKPVVATDMDTDLLATTEDNKVLSSIQNVVDSSDSLETHAEEQAECGPKLKKRKKRSEGVRRLNECKDSSTSDSLEEAKQVDETTDIDKDLPATTEDNEVLTSTRSIDVNSDVADGCQLEKKQKKKKKKKTKVKDAETNSMLESDRTANEIFAKSQDMDLNPESSQVRTLSNGLTIEDLAKGKEDGKVAIPGRKVKVYYTGKLKENGHVFCSNVGEAPYKFCLGDEQVLEGWNIGLEGMRVGDRRRLTIPPAMGYGSEGLEEDVPPNSWLIYDIELVGVRG